MEIKSVQKYVIASPKKLREVVYMVKKLTPAKAYEVLPFTGKRASEKLRKVVGSALANARQKSLKEENLFFKEIQISDGPRLKRWRAGARGMAKPYVRKMSHIRVVLGVREEKIEEKSASGKLNRKNANTEKAEVTEKTEKNSNTESAEKRKTEKTGNGRTRRRLHCPLQPI